MPLYRIPAPRQWLYAAKVADEVMTQRTRLVWGEATGSRRTMRTMWAMTVFWMALVTIALVMAVAHADPVLGAWAVLIVVVRLLRRLSYLRHYVDRYGVHRPLRPVLPWEAFECVIRPIPGDDLLALRRRSGSVRTTGLLVHHLDDLTRISGLPVHSPTPVPRLPLPEPPTRTWAQQQTDLAARAARIRVKNAELLADSPPALHATPGQPERPPTWEAPWI